MSAKRKPKTKGELVKDYFTKWLTPLGLLWWSVKVSYYDDPNEVLQIFGDPGENRAVFAHTTVDWKYSIAWIQVNLLAVNITPEEDLEEAVVHELVHILVNEMREGEMHHEERVVTGLQKAFIWVSQEKWG